MTEKSKKLAARGARLRAARLTAGHHNASAFARLINLSPNSVYRFEAGQLTPSAEVALRWADACDTSVRLLIAGPSEATA